MRVTFNELAERELNDAAQYYNEVQVGLGASFVSEVERCTQAIVEFPESSPPVLGSIRRRLCRRFPYALLFIVTPDELRILAVMNLRRRPGYWVGRG